MQATTLTADYYQTWSKLELFVEKLTGCCVCRKTYSTRNGAKLNGYK